MWQRFGQHPYVSFRTERNNVGQFMIHMHCSVCNANHSRYCNNPQLLNQRVGAFALVHAHGLRPVVGG